MKTSETAVTIKDQYLKDIEQYRKNVLVENDVTSPVRNEALRLFSEYDFPTSKNEEWKYTNVKPFLNNSYKRATESRITDITPYKIAGEDCHCIVFVNGIFTPSLSSYNSNDVIAENISDAIVKYPELVKKYFGKNDYRQSDVFSSLNTSLFKDGAFIYIKENLQSDLPFHFIYIAEQGYESYISYYRNLLIAAPGSQLKVVESFHSAGDANPVFVNSYTEIFVDANASVDYYKLQLENNNVCHIDTTTVEQQSKSRFSSHTVTLGGTLVRNNLNVKLSGEYCETQMMGLSVMNGTQHTDNHTFMDHAMPNCYSNELYKNIMDDASHGVFSGKIMVRKDAQKTNAFQSCKNILLGDKASADAKPQLEIFADDVKCSHGATTGRLNEEALFYMQARGIGKDKARALLVYAFAGEIFDSIKIATLRNNLEKLLAAKLKTEF